MKSKKGISRVSKTMIVLQLFIVMSFGIFIVFFNPNASYPKNNQVIDARVVDFSFNNADKILIDDNPNFNSPMQLDYNYSSSIKLSPGTYYWKAIGVIESPVKSFTISSKVGIEIDENNKSLKNVGNVPINITQIDEEQKMTGLVILDIQTEYPADLENSSTYRGEIYDKNK